jgi:hypothetical protein
LFATSSAVPGIVEGVHCAAAIPVCAPRCYPLSDALQTHSRGRVCTHTRPHARVRACNAAGLAPLCRSNRRACGRRSISRSSGAARKRTPTYAHMSALTLPFIHPSPPLVFLQHQRTKKNFQAQTPQRRISSSH